MRRCFILFLLAVINLVVLSQEKITLKGKVTDSNQNPLAGVHVYLHEIQSGTTTNEFGEYYLTDLISGNINLGFSYTGFESPNIEAKLQNGSNTVDVILQRASYNLEGVVVTAQKREQQIQNVPISISSVEGQQISELSIQSLDQFSNLVPGLNVRVQSNQRPNFVIRGLTSDEVSPNAQPRVSLFFNNAPVTRASGGVMELYDMDRIEVLKGPQGTLFGRGAQIGAVHFLTKMPTNKFEGYVSGGLGNYNQNELQFAVNAPLIENKLNTRFAAAYHTQDGYVENTFGGTLNGKDTKAGRFSLQYLPCDKTRVNFVLNYQQDRAPGVAFISKLYPNTNGVKDIFSYEASLDQGKDLRADKDLLSAMVNIRHYINPNLSISSITSYQTNESFERWDGDGSAAGAIDFSEDIDAKLFNQELRLNYTLGDKLSGFTGFNYLREEVEQTFWFSTNEQHMAYLFLGIPEFMIGPDGQPMPMPALPLDPQLGPLGGLPLPAIHEEESVNTAENTATEFFTDASLEIIPKLKVSAGIRIVFDDSKVTNQSNFLAGSPSTLGLLVGNSPNLFFKPSDLQKTASRFTGFTGRLAANYKLGTSSNIFLSYAKGRRPNVIQYQADGTSEILNDEIVHSFDLGFKTVINNQLLFDATAFYYNYNHFQTSAWIADPGSGEFAYVIKDAGKATSYGLETSFQYHILKTLKIFGNYAYTHARYNNKDDDGNPQEYADNQFRLTPDHSFNLSAKYMASVNSNIQFFALPSVSYRSHFYFEDANTEGIEQDAYALFNLSTGIRLAKPLLTFTLFARNLFDKNYLISAGNTGSLFGIPTFVPAIPRTYGFKVRWDF